MNTKKVFFSLTILSFFFLFSCSDERPGQIEEIKKSEKSNQEKIKQIMDISEKCISCGETKTEIMPIDENSHDTFLAEVEYFDKYFVFESKKQMIRIVKKDIAKSIWRLFHDTKDLGLEKLIVYYYAKLINEPRFLVFQISFDKTKADNIPGFYTVDPYDVDSYDLFLPDSEQKKIIEEVIKNFNIDIDNTPGIEF